jgi:hypothetical protein
MKSKWSVDDIMNLSPCTYGANGSREQVTNLFKSLNCTDYVTLDKLLTVDIPADDFLWLLLRTEFVPEEKLHEFAVWCFEEFAQPVWEKHFPNNKLPQETIKTKKTWLEKKVTTEELDTNINNLKDIIESITIKSAKSAISSAISTASHDDAARSDSFIAVAARSAAHAVVYDIENDGSIETHKIFIDTWNNVRNRQREKLIEIIKK